jgi:hypothetical protein
LIEDMEHASFLLTDPPALVQAALACPVCLHSVEWEDAGAGVQPAVDCECRNCGHVRTVHLTAAQMLRLTVADDDDGQTPVGGHGTTWRQLFMLL